MKVMVKKGARFAVLVIDRSGVNLLHHGWEE